MAICIEKSFTHSCYFDWARVGADCERCYTFNYKMRVIPLCMLMPAKHFTDI